MGCRVELGLSMSLPVGRIAGSGKGLTSSGIILPGRMGEGDGKAVRPLLQRVSVKRRARSQAEPASSGSRDRAPERVDQSSGDSGRHDCGGGAVPLGRALRALLDAPRRVLEAALAGVHGGAGGGKAFQTARTAVRRCILSEECLDAFVPAAEGLAKQVRICFGGGCSMSSMPAHFLSIFFLFSHLKSSASRIYRPLTPPYLRSCTAATENWILSFSTQVARRPKMR